jgi:hypothetical protein
MDHTCAQLLKYFKELMFENFHLLFFFFGFLHFKKSSEKFKKMIKKDIYKLKACFLIKTRWFQFSLDLPAVSHLGSGDSYCMLVSLFFNRFFIILSF